MPTSYQRYLADPEMRRRIDEEVRRQRANAVHRYVTAPLAAGIAWLGRLPARTFQLAPCDPPPLTPRRTTCNQQP